MKKHSYLFFLLPLLLFCCSTKEKDDSFVVISLESLLNNPQKMPLTEIVKDFKQIPLETNDQTLIKWINNIIAIDNFLFIVHDDRCSVFDLKGKFLHTIGQKGEGPHEYSRLDNVFIEGNKICLYNYAKQKLFRYSFDGSYIDEITFSESFRSLYPIFNNHYLSYSGNISGKDSIKITVIHQDKGIHTIPHTERYEDNSFAMVFYNEGIVYPFNERFFFKEIFNDTIYSIEQNYSIKPRFVLDQGRYKPNIEKRYKMTDLSTHFWTDMGCVSLVGESTSYLFFNISMNKNTQTFFLDKRSNKVTNAELGYPGDFNTKDKCEPKFVSFDQKKLISYIESEEDENPTIVFMTLKD